VGVKAKLTDRFLNNLRADLVWDTLNLRVVCKMLLNCHLVEDQVLLWAVANKLSRLFEVLLDIKT